MKREGAHQEFIDHIAEEFHFKEQERLFLQQMRMYRNRIAYKGFMIHENYIILNQEKINRIIRKLIRFLHESLSS